MGTMEVSSIRDMIADYEDKRAQAEELEAQLKDLKAERDAAEKMVIMAILTTAEETGIDDLGVTVDGRKYTVKVKEYFTIPKPAREEAFSLLRQLGHGDIITERVDDRTLSSEMAGVMEEYRKEHEDGDFPETYGPLVGLMSRYSKPSLSRLKVK